MEPGTRQQPCMVDRTNIMNATTSTSALVSYLRSETIEDKFDAVLMLTLLNVMLWGPQYWYTETLLFLVCVPGLIIKALRHSPWFWWTAAGCIVHMIVINWAWADNHKYVMTYWMMGIAMSLHVKAENRLDVMATNARCILGLSMLFATVWKLISPEYTSGAFFEVLFLTDRRFDGSIAMLTDLTYGQLLENQSRVKLLREGYMTWVNPETQQLYSSAMVKWLAFIATWWTVFIEGAKGFLFLIPSNRDSVFFWRNFTLVLFCFTTYIIAPVPGFGCTLCCMGMATCLERGNNWFRSYQLGYLMVLFWKTAGEPIREMIARI